ncbi:hypothetical protein BDD12DRAFT_843539 [Trichophaea hybrida]|nr:hypothetical protein BDD12DRAFT_843539 [Trichophaea hybrida]
MDTPSASTSTTSTSSSSSSSSSSSLSPPSKQEEHPDPHLDRPLAIAIAQFFTPASPKHTTTTTTTRIICTHSLVARVRSDTCCQHCRKTHWFGWVYRCGSCGYRVCHNCRPKFVERSWDSIGGVLNEFPG